MKTQVEVFGDWGAGKGEPSYYATDQWNEINPSVYEATYLKSMSSAVYDAMAAVDPDAVWVMQGWSLCLSEPLSRLSTVIYLIYLSI